MRKASGDIPDLSWSELSEMARARRGYGLAAAINGEVSLEGSVSSPFVTEADLQAGAGIYRERCATCHGGEGVGWHAPPLNKSGLKHGDSDLALYKVVRDGIPNTNMKSLGLSFAERWQVVGYVKQLQIRGSASQSQSAKRLDVRVPSERLLKAGSRPDEWLTYSGSLNGQRYSPLAQVTAKNAHQLRLLWSKQFDTVEAQFEATPIVVDNVMFVTAPPAKVIAVDAETGAEYWSYQRNVPVDLPLAVGG